MCRCDCELGPLVKQSGIRAVILHATGCTSVTFFTVGLLLFTMMGDIDSVFACVMIVIFSILDIIAFIWWLIETDLFKYKDISVSIYNGCWYACFSILCCRCKTRKITRPVSMPMPVPPATQIIIIQSSSMDDKDLPG